MKKILDKMILIVIIYIVLFIVSYEILRQFSLYFREWVYICSAILIIIGFSIGIYYKISKSKKKKRKVIFSVLYTIMLIILLGNPITIFFVAFSYQPEHIVEKDNRKMVAYVNGFLDTFVYYYEYKNPFVIGNKVMEEWYGNGGFDPIKNSRGYEYKILSTTYYDKDGNVIQKEDTTQDKSSKNEITNEVKDINIEVPKKEENYYIENNKCYTEITGEKIEIITPNKAADIADKEALNEKYQYQSWKSEFYSRGINKDDSLSIKLTYGLDEIDRLYHWYQDWAKSSYENRLMWEIRLFDENDPLTSLYIFVDSITGEIVGAGQMSD